MRMDSTDFENFLKSRRSIRRFKQIPIPGEVLNRILEVATYSPSAHNKQPWHFVVLSTMEKKENLALEITGKFKKDMERDGIPDAEIEARIIKSIKRVHEAPVVIILCRDASENSNNLDKAHNQKETILDIQSIAMAGLQLLLAAHAEGFGGTWICWPLFAQDETRHVLDLPQEWDPQGMLFLGYPDEHPDKPAKKPLKEVVHFIP
jgi:coenzyme F420-0:L-glutamate ligase / coenzyme F420-1:gamma-L-glutamate ligase